MSKERFSRFFQHISAKYGRYLDYIDHPSKYEIKAYLLASAKSLLQYFKGGQGKKRRLPIYSLWLLFILIALNIGISIHNNIANASSSTTTTTTQNNTGTQTQNTETQTTDVSPISQKIQMDSAPTVCPKVPEGTTVTLADIVTYAMTVSDDTDDVKNYFANPGSVNVSLQVNGTGTVISNAQKANQPDQQTIETNCENAFGQGVVNINNGDELIVRTWPELPVQGSYLSQCTNQGDPFIIGVMDTDNVTTHEVYCLYRKTNKTWTFPCSDVNGAPDEGVIATDWLSGDVVASNANSGIFEQTTITEPVLFPAMQAIGFAIMAPAILLIGLQLLASQSGFRMADAMESASRVIMSAILIGVCYAAIQELLSISNIISLAIVTFHKEYGYPASVYYPNYLPGGQGVTTQTTQVEFGYTLANEGSSDPGSYRGIVVPLTRWGCAANDFTKILGSKLATDLAGFIPIVGNFIKMAGQIKDAVDLVKNAGEFIKTILSVMLAVQLLVRLALLNFYIMMAPVAFSCWGLPGGVGQNVVRGWFKGFFSVLTIQVVQLFVITIVPLLIPQPLPVFPGDNVHVLSSFFNELPSIAVLWAVLRVPKMLGTTATTMIATAGQIAGGAIVAVGAAAYNIV